MVIIRGLEFVHVLMDTQSSIPGERECGGDMDFKYCSEPDCSGENRRSTQDRRAEDRRRSTRGLFEVRARRDRVVADRRQHERRADSRLKLLFWRRSSAQ